MEKINELPSDRQKYEELEKRASQEERNLIINDRNASLRGLPRVDMSYYSSVLRGIESMRKTLKDMREKALEEGNELNSQYDELLERAQKANEELINFQKEKLGMKDESEPQN